MALHIPVPYVQRSKTVRPLNSSLLGFSKATWVKWGHFLGLLGPQSGFDPYPKGAGDVDHPCHSTRSCMCPGEVDTLRLGRESYWAKQSDLWAILELSMCSPKPGFCRAPAGKNTIHTDQLKMPVLWPNQKMGQRTKQTFLQRRHIDG